MPQKRLPFQLQYRRMEGLLQQNQYAGAMAGLGAGKTRYRLTTGVQTRALLFAAYATPPLGESGALGL